MMILQILGVILIVIVLVIVAFYVYIRVTLGNIFNYTPQSEPLAIHLVEDVLPEWLQAKHAKKMVDNILTLGFKQHKAYTVFEMPDISLQHFYKDNIHAVLYQHTTAGVWLDFGFTAVDGTEYFSTNMPVGGEMKVAPHRVKMVDVNASVNELYQIIIRAIENTEIMTAPAEDFVSLFETTYKNEIRWKNSQGGLSYEEFIALADNMKSKKFTEQQLSDAFAESKRQELLNWHDPAIEEYMNSLPEQDKAELQEHELTATCFIVPFTGNALAFIEYLEQCNIINEQQNKKFKEVYSSETDLFTLFDTINNLFSSEMRAQLLTEQDFPLPLRVYAKSDFHYTHLLDHSQCGK